MNGRRTTNRLEAAIACSLLVLVSGCATSGGAHAPTLTKATAVPAGSAEGGITIGKSTKADVLAVLGKTTAIRFDSGYEVWVYHLTQEPPAKGEAEKAEFVVLFSPAGVVTKTRIRPALTVR